MDDDVRTQPSICAIGAKNGVLDSTIVRNRQDGCVAEHQAPHLTFQEPD